MKHTTILLKVLVIFYCTNFVKTTDNICWNTRLVTKRIKESYKATFWKTEKYSCYLFWTCTYRQKYYDIKYRVVTRNVSEKYKECCSGYEWTDDKNEQCKLKCNKHCENGQCTDTDTCICDKGYIPHNESVCIPTCIPSCNGGTCIAPNVCQCNLNSTVNTTDSLCECNAGFEMNNSGICVPIGDIPVCVNAECTVPDNCFCLPMDQTTETWNTSSTTCLDDCMSEHNSTRTCEDENDCKSIQNFTNFWIGISIALVLTILILICGIYVCYRKGICKYKRPLPEVKDSEKCITGECIARNVCQCAAGYKLLAGSTHKCEPVCAPDCVHANYTAPNVCTCHAGHRSAESSHICEPATIGIVAAV